MLRLVLLVLYFIASSSTSPQAKMGVTLLGLHQPPARTAEAGAGNDPDGRLHQPPPTTDAGAGYDPNG
jgi:hypothetical protein